MNVDSVKPEQRARALGTRSSRATPLRPGAPPEGLSSRNLERNNCYRSSSDSVPLREAKAWSKEGRSWLALNQAGWLLFEDFLEQGERWDRTCGKWATSSSDGRPRTASKRSRASCPAIQILWFSPCRTAQFAVAP